MKEYEIHEALIQETVKWVKQWLPRRCTSITIKDIIEIEPHSISSLFSPERAWIVKVKTIFRDEALPEGILFGLCDGILEYLFDAELNVLHPLQTEHTPLERYISYAG